VRDISVVWADALLAAALVAVDPGLGGALVRASPGPVRDAWLAGAHALMPAGSPWRRMPVQIEDERLLGGLDLAAAIGSGQRLLQRGLLAEAHGGAVIAPMAERLSSGTAARLAGALDDGVVTVARDGMTERLPARFVLLALDEGAGDERPPAALAERLAFLIDLEGVSYRDALPISATAEDILEARVALTRIDAPGAAAVEALIAAAQSLGIDSLRPPLQALRTACALAALEGRTEVDQEDLGVAARLVLAPRATRIPAPQPESPPEPEVPEDQGQPRESEADRPEPADDPSGGDDLSEALNDLVLEAARSALPEGLEALWLSRGKTQAVPSPGPSGAGARQVSLLRGRRIGVRRGLPRSSSGLDVVETLKAAAPWQRLRALAPGRKSSEAAGAGLKFHRDDLRIKRFELRRESTVIFVVDASGSAALQRLAETKGAVELLLAEAYVRRTQVALIAFRGFAPELLLPPTRSLTRARRQLADLAGGGATPLARALEDGRTLALAERARGRTPLLVIMTDGRGNIALDGAAFRTRAETDALAAARRIGVAAIATALIDISARPRGDGARLAEAMGARFAALPYVEAGRVKDMVRALDPGASA